MGAVRSAARDARLSDRVHVMGHREDVPDWLAASTVWMLPTERENFSLAVLEALAAGCAILSTPCSGNDEVLADGVNALVHPVGDVAVARAHLRTLLSDPELRTLLSINARATASHYGVARMAARYRAVYEAAL